MGAKGKQMVTTSVSVDECDEVIVSKTGERFHRIGSWVFETGCKTEFGFPTEEISVKQALQRGYTPCESIGCFHSSVAASVTE
jgi:hypothetical protein